MALEDIPDIRTLSEGNPAAFPLPAVAVEEEAGTGNSQAEDRGEDAAVGLRDVATSAGSVDVAAAEPLPQLEPVVRLPRRRHPPVALHLLPLPEVVVVGLVAASTGAVVPARHQVQQPQRIPYSAPLPLLRRRRWFRPASVLLVLLHPQPSRYLRHLPLYSGC